MANRRYALERGGPKRLQLRWRWGLKDFEVELDGQLWRLGRDALDTGAAITLPDGSALLVQRIRRRWWSIELRDELRVERGGVPIPGSDGDPRVIGRRAASVILLLTVAHVAPVALWFVFARAASEGPPGPGGDDAILAVLAAGSLVMATLAILAGLGRRLPVALAAGLFTLELVVMIASTGAPSVGVLIQVLVVVHLVGAWRRMRPRASLASLASVFE